MKLWAFVFIALFAAVFFLGATSSLVCGRGGARCGDGVEVAFVPGDLFTRGAGVIREAVQRRPRATRSDSEGAVLGLSVCSACGADQAMDAVSGSASERRITTYAVGAVRCTRALPPLLLTKWLDDRH